MFAELFRYHNHGLVIVTVKVFKQSKVRRMTMRVGIGYDVHKLVENRALILGGVEIPWEKGLLGHSDADVLLHAIMDASHFSKVFHRGK